MSAATGELDRVARRYRAFAVEEARGSSESYERLALGVAASGELLEFLLSLPADRRQPNLFLAAVRHLHGVPDNPRRLAEIVHQDRTRIGALMLSRTTQTNEPARCAVLLPLLAQLPQPLALLEVGASAGLCLLPDKYGYAYDTATIEPPSEPPSGDAPIFPCRTSGAVPLPVSVPRIVWRRGLDLKPVDLSVEAEVAWLETLVWPEQDERLHRLRAAIEIARRAPPPVVRGDLSFDLEQSIAAAPDDATLVVFHTAVLAYVRSQDSRDRFADAVLNSRAVWISNEAPGVFPALSKAAPPTDAPGSFLLMRDGVPLAWTRPHGQSIDWFGP